MLGRIKVLVSATAVLTLLVAGCSSSSSASGTSTSPSLGGTTVASGSSSGAGPAAAGASAAVTTGGGSADSALASELKRPGQLSVVTQDANAPMSSIVNGQLTGYDIEFSTEIARRLNLKPTFVSISFDSIFAAVANHQYDIGSASSSITLPRLKTVSFSSPYFVGSFAIVVLKSSNINDEAALDGKRLGVVTASITEQYATDKYKQSSIVPFPDASSLQLALQAKQIDAAFLDGGVATAYAKQSNYPAKIILTVPNFDQPAGISIAKDHPRLLAAVNKQIANMVSDGTYGKLYTKWFDPSVPKLPGPDFKPQK